MNLPESLNCPNCGSGVMSDRTQCEFCGTLLKTVGCAACLGMMFLGSKFCGHCGATAQAVELLDEANPGDCPRCKLKLRALKIDSVHIRECERCGGFWSSVENFETLCTNKEQQAAVIGFAGSHAHGNENPAAISYVPCPDCKQLMNRSNFARSSGVIIDICKEHGVWFDRGELPNIIVFIEKGGLARARQKEKIAMDEELVKIRDEQRKLGMMDRHSSGANFDTDKDELGLGQIVSFLFD